MRLILTEHLKTRLKQRQIPIKLVKEILKNSKEFYWDNLRGRHIMVAEVYYKSKDRKMMMAYDKIKDNIEGVTMHPITETEIEHRIASGRWHYEKTGS